MSLTNDKVINLVFRKYQTLSSDQNESIRGRIEAIVNVWKETGNLEVVNCSGDSVKKLLNWISAQTLDVVLSADWNSFKTDYQNYLVEAIKLVQHKLETRGVEAAFLWPFGKLVDISLNPWSHLEENGIDPVSRPFRFFCSETAYLIAIRLKKLCDSNKDELAFNMISAFVDFKRNAEFNFFAINGSNNLMWFLFDIYAALLYKFGQNNVLIALIKQPNFEAGIELVHRLATKNVAVCKIWKDSWKIALVAAQTYLTDVSLTYTRQMRPLLETYIVLYMNICKKFNVMEDFASTIDRVSSLCTKQCLDTLLNIMQEKNKVDELKEVRIKLYIKAISQHRNRLELHKQDGDHHSIRKTNASLADIFSNLADFFQSNEKVARECILTSFCVNPSTASMKKLERCLVNKFQKHFNLSSNNTLLSQYADLSLDRAMNHKELGISEDLCDDLMSCIAGSRYKCLSWNMPWKVLESLCKEYLGKPQSASRFVTDLKFLNVDYNDFIETPPSLPEVYDLVEKGYEEYLEDCLFLNLDFPSKGSESNRSNATRGRTRKNQRRSKKNSRPRIERLEGEE